MPKPPHVVQVQKWESVAGGGSADDDLENYPTELEPEEDALACAGLYGAETGKPGTDKIVALYREGDRWYFEDTDYSGGARKSLADLAAAGSGISEITHEALDSLVHEIAETCYLEVVRSGNKVSTITYWTDAGKTTKVRDVVVSRDGNGKVSQTVETQYDGAGDAKAGQTLTTTLTRTGDKVTSMTIVES